MTAKLGLVAAAFSAHLGVEIKPKEEVHHLFAQSPGQLKPVALELHNILLHTHDVYRSDDSITARVLHDDLEVPVDATKTVGEIKQQLASTVGMHPESQMLLYYGLQLSDHLSLSAQNVVPGTQLSLAWGPVVLGLEPVPRYYIDAKDLDPQYDYDYTNITDVGQSFERGGHEYQRPCGWDRTAVKVIGRYADTAWLGSSGGPGEWAVSYHGTAADNVRPIIVNGYDINKVRREKFGTGIYSTPSMRVASDYAKKFTYHGKNYKMVLQNRVDLSASNVIPASKTGVGAEYFVTPKDCNIRPYGVCLKDESGPQCIVI